MYTMKMLCSVPSIWDNCKSHHWPQHGKSLHIHFPFLAGGRQPAGPSGECSQCRCTWVPALVHCKHSDHM